ncbi:UPF0739 protein C1orf74 homolog [Hyla sarda]|uniref:UPF0739 protein C1orf74 homolog n=1 Tax=Hyla sarda TaxID=327740 RepID=UPI0024C2A974|nr:UPF0739 protein C1orf74 homolog [Hyla sarda]XP_056414944.1 UPF0739 protein C1orf74 homolog [Hyla sarda]XP_056414945.1 UPF0739 protein C1orf74 homolog [Hyla sarda]XP_056414946.1 UPF0739 protein C1orf74 homolog [Hyla sarda]XP_056414947.1 UPF0739 protein C1orf74 homolog [Hyla sarda]XP_056414948.1 UPF0739 protein C1orf74 homolog [Hyla sarda]XP_056414950.1 UPF0739 protein C1orf74 homolog [Hyla sarda]
MSLIPDLFSAAKQHLKGCKKSFALRLAAQILAVECGLKPCFLYDLSAADILQVQRYLKELHQIGFIQGPLHIINVEGTILIINVPRAASYLAMLLNSRELHVIDVSATLSHPEVLAQDRLGSIQSQLSDLLTLLTPYQSELPGTISVADIPSTEWNLCTIFGFLLHYPTVYWFDTTRNFENCLSFAPLKHVSVETTCSTIGLHKLQVYSFSIPESVYHTVQLFLQAWTESLKDTFGGQCHFTDLNIIMETVTLPAVAL